jgi:hypothetical protein
VAFRETPRRARKDHWPTVFDLEGVPRDTKVREELLRGEEMVQNKFTDSVIDLSNPPKTAYIHQEYPKLLYKFDAKPKSVKSEAEEEAAIADGWSTKPVSAPVPKPIPEELPTADIAEESSDETGANSDFRVVRKRK